MKFAAARSVQPLGGKPCGEPGTLFIDVNHDHRAYQVLRSLCLYHPTPVDRDSLIRIGGFAAQGPVCGPAAFEFWLIQLNIDLPRLGWRIDERAESYRLEKL